MTVFLLPLLVVFELVKRLLTPFMFPFAYLFRKQARARRWAGKFSPLWYLLDDTIHSEGEAQGRDVEYCLYGKRQPLGFITEHLPEGKFKEFARAFSWGAIRNNCINLTWAWCAGEKVRAFRLLTWGRGYYEDRRFKRGLLLPYIEAWLPWSNFRFQLGWISNGRWQVQARTYP